MEWLSKFLVTVLVVTGIFVAIASGCHGSAAFVPDGGSCSNAQFDAPAIPNATLTDVAMPDARFDFLAILVAVAALAVVVAATPERSSLLRQTETIPRRIAFSMRN